MSRKGKTVFISDPSQIEQYSNYNSLGNQIFDNYQNFFTNLNDENTRKTKDYYSRCSAALKNNREKLVNEIVNIFTKTKFSIREKDLSKMMEVEQIAETVTGTVPVSSYTKPVMKEMGTEPMMKEMGTQANIVRTRTKKEISTIDAISKYLDESHAKAISIIQNLNSTRESFKNLPPQDQKTVLNKLSKDLDKEFLVSEMTPAEFACSVVNARVPKTSKSEIDTIRNFLQNVAKTDSRSQVKNAASLLLEVYKI